MPFVIRSLMSATGNEWRIDKLSLLDIIAYTAIQIRIQPLYCINKQRLFIQHMTYRAYMKALVSLFFNFECPTSDEMESAKIAMIL